MTSVVCEVWQCDEEAREVALIHRDRSLEDSFFLLSDPEAKNLKLKVLTPGPAADLFDGWEQWQECFRDCGLSTRKIEGGWEIWMNEMTDFPNGAAR